MQIRTHSIVVFALAFNYLNSPATADDLSIEFKIRSSVATSVAVSQDAKLLAVGGNDGEITIWNLQNNEFKLRTRLSTTIVASLAFARNPRCLATTDHKGLVGVFDVDSGNLLKSFDSQCQSFASVCVSPSGDRITTVGMDDVARTWTIPSGKHVDTFDRYRVCSAAYLNERILVIGTRDKKIALYDSDSKGSIIELDAGSLKITSIAVANNGSDFASTSGLGDAFGGNFTLWTQEPGQDGKLNINHKNYDGLLFPQFVANSKIILAIAAHDGSLVAIDRQTQIRQVIAENRHDENTNERARVIFAVSTDGQFVAIATGNTIEFCSLHHLLKRDRDQRP